MRLKHFFRAAALAALLLCAALCIGCAAPAPRADGVELVVFAASSLTETVEKLAAQYEAAHPGVTIICNFDSSGTLKTQIGEGAVCDLFLSAGQKQMDQLDDGGLDLLLPGSRLDLLENRIVLCVPAGNPKKVQSFDRLAAQLPEGGLLLAIGNSDVPVGQYTQKIFAYYGLDEAALAQAGALTYGTNVKEVTTQLREAAADCGIIYATDAYSAGLTVVDEALSSMCGQVVYPAAVLRGSAHPAEAQAFLAFLTSEDAMRAFAEVGFAPTK